VRALILASTAAEPHREKGGRMVHIFDAPGAAVISMFSTFGAPEAAVIIVIVLIVFGVGKLPQVGGALGKGIREFRKGKSGEIGETKELDQPKEQDQKQDDKPD